jgi:signal transduction histidine kinase
LEPAWILADTYQLKQVLINLIQNSAESVGKDGVITLGLQTGAGALAGHNGSAAILSVTDTGKGIPAEVQKRLFDPFFTTKDGGTGLGLAIAARIVEKHGGLLRYKTEVNRGTTFEIVLPGTGDNAIKNTAH